MRTIFLTDGLLRKSYWLVFNYNCFSNVFDASYQMKSECLIIIGTLS